MNRIHIIGRKNSGKTTLVVELVQQLTARGLRVGTIKHTHHHHELDVPGKDSFRHREAGAAAVGILSPSMNAVFWPGSLADGSESREDRYEMFSRLFQTCEMILVEGDSRTTALKVEVWRKEVTEQPLAKTDPSIHAVITDDSVDVAINVWPRIDLPMIVEKLLALIRDGR